MLGEIITYGRKYSGESFQYSHFQNLIEVYHHDRLILKDNILLQPAIMPLSSMGILEAYTYQGTFIFVNTKGISSDELIKQFYEESQNLTDVVVGISATQHGCYGYSFFKTDKLECYVHAIGGAVVALCGVGMVFLGW